MRSWRLHAAQLEQPDPTEVRHAQYAPSALKSGAAALQSKCLHPEKDAVLIQQPALIAEAQLTQVIHWVSSFSCQVL